MTEETKTTEVLATEEVVEITETTEAADSAESTEDVKVEVAWDQVLPVVRKVLEKNEAVSAFGRLLIEAESKKDALKERIILENKHLQTLLDDLKSELAIPMDQEWELDLPEAEGQSGFFVKKD